MTLRKRITRLLRGIMMLIAAAVLLAYPEYGYAFVILILDIMLLIYGIRLLVYYFTMTRFMVGGISTLFKGIIVIDLGLFISELDDTTKKMAMVYLIVCLIFSGVTDVFHAIEAKHLLGAWKYEIISGIIKVLIALSCLGFLDSSGILVLIYSIGLVHTALTYIVSAFRKTAIMYNDMEEVTVIQ